MDVQNEWLAQFGKRLSAERTKQGLTRKSLAKKANTSPDYLAQLERGNKTPSVNTLMKILRALNITADSLLYGCETSYVDIKNVILSDLYSLFSCHTTEETQKLFEIIKFISPYIKVNN